MNQKQKGTKKKKIVSISEVYFRVHIGLTISVVAPAQRDTQEPEVGDPGPSSSSAMKRKRQSSPVGAGNGSKKKKTRVQRDKEYGVVRGVDFIDVACVLNFDLPTSSRVYTHRVGRTARAGRTGMSLSFIVPETEWGKNKVVGCLESAKRDEATFKRIEAQQAARGSKIKGYNFDMKQVEAFRYRMQDALRAVTKTAIREARMKEIKTELLNSEKLKVRLFSIYLISKLSSTNSSVLFISLSV